MYKKGKTSMMKKINGKYYDLDPVNQIAEFWNGLDSTDPNYCREILYKDGEEEYLLFGEHGNSFDLASSSGNFTMSGEEVLKFITGEAMGWLASQDYYDIIEKEMTERAFNEKRKHSINELQSLFNKFMDEFISLHPENFNHSRRKVKTNKKTVRTIMKKVVINEMGGLNQSEINHFKFRAECVTDVLQLRIRLRVDCLKTIMEIGQFPDTVVDLYTTMSLDEVKKEIRSIEDGHVMLQTIALEHDYTGERDYELE